MGHSQQAKDNYNLTTSYLPSDQFTPSPHITTCMVVICGDASTIDLSCGSFYSTLPSVLFRLSQLFFFSSLLHITDQRFETHNLRLCVLLLGPSDLSDSAPPSPKHQMTECLLQEWRSSL